MTMMTQADRDEEERILAQERYDNEWREAALREEAHQKRKVLIRKCHAVLHEGWAGEENEPNYRELERGYDE